MKQVAFGALLTVLFVVPSFAEQRYRNPDSPSFVETIELYPSQFPFGPSDFGSVDIKLGSYMGSAERLGMRLEGDSTLFAEEVPSPIPACKCEAQSPVGRMYWAEYQVEDTGDFLGLLHYRILIRTFGDRACVNLYLKSTKPVQVFTIQDAEECLIQVPSGPSTAQLVRLKRILEMVKMPEIVGELPNWPEPFCLSCPPWPSFEADNAKLVARHRENVELEVKRVAEKLRRFNTKK